MVEDGLNIKDKKDKENFLERLVNFKIKYRVSVDVQDNEGRTVVHKAVIANDIQLLKNFLQKKKQI